MRITHDSHVDIVLFQLPVHVFIIHAPDTVLIADQVRMDDLIAGISECTGEADIGRLVQQHRVARLC